MGEFSVDQLYTIFGDLKSVQESQQRTLQKIEGIVSDRFAAVANSIAILGSSVEKLAANTGNALNQTGRALNNQNSTAKAMVAGQEEQINATKKLDQSLSQGFRSISSAFLSREGKQTEGLFNRREKRAELPVETEESKQLKLTRKELIALNTKMGILVKDIQEANKPEKTGSILTKFLSPLLLLFGGMAALSYGIIKFPQIKSFLTDLSKGKIGQALTGLINKMKPQDKTIQEWLRGLPLIGRFFDIYDAVNAFVKGDIKQGLKHLAFAIPGGEFLIEMLGGVTKKQFLAPSGEKSFMQGFSIEKIYERIVGKVQSLFEPITNFFNKIKEITTPMLEGTWSGLTAGLTALSDYFPILSPVANFLQGMSDDLFSSALAASARSSKPGSFGPLTLTDIAKEAMSKISDGITGFFDKISKLFGYIGQFVSAIGQVFSGDYRQQVSGISTIEQFSPGVGNVLRTALNVMETFKQYNITDKDSLFDVIRKVAFTKFQMSDKFSKQQTLSEEQDLLKEQIQSLPENDPQRAELMRRKELQAIAASKERTERERAARQEDIDIRALPKYSEEYKTIRTKQAAEAAYQLGNEYLGPVGGFLAEQIGAFAGQVRAAGEGLVDYAMESTGYKTREEEMTRTREETLRLQEEFNKRFNELNEEELRIKGENIQPLDFNRALEDINTVSQNFRAPNQVLQPTTPAPFRDLNSMLANQNSQFSELKTSFAENSDKMTNKLNYLQEIFLETKRQNELLADIRKSSMDMSKQPSSSVSIMQGGTNLNFGGNNSRSGMNRGAFGSDAFSFA